METLRILIEDVLLMPQCGDVMDAYNQEYAENENDLDLVFFVRLNSREGRDLLEAVREFEKEFCVKNSVTIVEKAGTKKIIVSSEASGPFLESLKGGSLHEGGWHKKFLTLAPKQENDFKRKLQARLRRVDLTHFHWR